MQATTPTRTKRLPRIALGLAAAGFVAVGWAAAGLAQHPMAQPHPAPQQRMAPPPRRMNPGVGQGGANRPAPGANQAARNGARGEHLNEWMNAHSNLSPAQQQQALENEPGFRQLPQPTQQRYRDRLSQLNAMNPQQRDRLLQRNEQMERLTPAQRGQVRGAMQQLGALPQDQRHVVARSFNELRGLPPEQRNAAMSRIPLNDAQRSTLTNLMSVEPILPKTEAAQH